MKTLPTDWTVSAGQRRDSDPFCPIGRCIAIYTFRLVNNISRKYTLALMNFIHPQGKGVIP